MGICASSPRAKQSKVGVANYSIKRSSTVQVIHVDGGVQEFKLPIKAKNILSKNLSHFLCRSESMSIGMCMPAMPDEEELQLGQIYFLIPLSQARKKATLEDLCSLAVKANRSLCNEEQVET